MHPGALVILMRHMGHEIFEVLWYFPECKIAVISTSYVDLSVSQNVEKSVT